MKRLLSLILALTLCLGLAVPAMASMDDDHLFEPLEWFEDWPDGSELVNWDIYDDENATGLLLYFYTDPQVGVDLFDAYTGRLDECGDVLRVGKEEFDSGFSGKDNDTDRESRYRYLGRKRTGVVTALRSGEYCDFAVQQVWLDEDFLLVALAWGEDFPIEVDPDDLVTPDIDDLVGALSSDELPDGPVIPDAWAFFNEEATHEDENVENGVQSDFWFDIDGVDAAYEYVELLQSGDFDLELVEEKEQGYSDGGGTYRYYFSYTGDEDVSPVQNYNIDRDDVAMAVKINDFPDMGWCEVVIWFSDDLIVADTGDRSTVTGISDRHEALEGPMGGKGSRSGDADYTMRVGESLRLDCPRKFGANTEQYRWAVDEGADLVSLEGEISASCTVTAKAPGRVVVSVVYDHSYDTTDVLTGNPTYGFAAPTYYFIIEITK